MLLNIKLFLKVNSSGFLQVGPALSSSRVVALHSNDSALAPHDGTPAGHFGVVDQCKSINEGILSHLEKKGNNSSHFMAESVI